MNAIRKGDKNPTVKRWQFFLVGQGYGYVVADGDFGANTERATKEFQKKHGIQADGVAGNECFAKAMSLGFPLVDDPDDATKDGPNWPPRPDFKPLSQAQVRSTFGSFDFTILSNKSSVKIKGNWEAENIVTVRIPQLAKLPPYKTDKIRVHKLAGPQFEELFAKWESAGLSDRLFTYDGAFNPRLIRGSRTDLSCHAWGIAIDVNVKWNGLGAVPAYRGEEGSVRELVTIANKLGFYWGGHFSRGDGMHFEIAKLM